MEPYRGYAELGQAIDVLDGDREAEPLLGLHSQRLAARETAARVLQQARARLAALESEVHRLDGGLLALEEQLIDLARRRQRPDRKPSAPPTAAADAAAAAADAADAADAAVDTDDTVDRAEALRDRLKITIEEARRVVRAAADARPGAPIPAEHLRPGFAVNASFNAGGQHPGMPDLAPPGGGRPGVRNARGVAQAMIAQVEKSRPRKPQENG